MNKQHIAIIGAGPGGLFLVKRLVELKRTDIIVSIFEEKDRPGEGMPYSTLGAGIEHITNVSGNEIPGLPLTLVEWVKTQPAELLQQFGLEKEGFSEFKVLPRLLFGSYLAAQFDMLVQQGRQNGMEIRLHFATRVLDIEDSAGDKKIKVITGFATFDVDHAIICTGHTWPLVHEGKVNGYYDSPYPSAKLEKKRNHPIAIRGSSLTAIDAIRTLARAHGEFIHHGKHDLSWKRYEDVPEFKIILHSRNGLLPAVRFHLEDPHLSKQGLASREELQQHRKENEGFISLDFLFDRNFKDLLRQEEPAFYNSIKDMNLETFVDKMMSLRDPSHPFEYFKKEYAEAERSIRNKDSIYWKEMLAVLSFAMNYPAKYFCAEDMQRLKTVLMPLISIVIAFVPQRSCEELIALYEAGALDIVTVGDDNEIEIHPTGGITYHIKTDIGEYSHMYYETFIDSIGQRQMEMEDFPFPSLVNNGSVTPATLKFRSFEEGQKQYNAGNANVKKKGNDFFARVPGLAITDQFNVVGRNGQVNPGIYLMAVPYIGGYNPDYSGLDFCEEASGRVIEGIFGEEINKEEL